MKPEVKRLCNYGILDNVLPERTAHALRLHLNSLKYERVDYGNQGTYHKQAKCLAAEHSFLVSKPMRITIAMHLGIPASKLLKWEPHWFDSVYLQKNQWAQIHTDRTKGNRVALVYYLNDNWQESDGGILVLNSYSPKKQQIRLVPVFNRLVMLEVTKDSWHHVTKVKSNKTRHNLIGWFTDRWDGKL